MLRISLRDKQARRYQQAHLGPVLTTGTGSVLTPELLDRLAEEFRRQHAALFSSSMSRPGTEADFLRAAEDLLLRWTDPPFTPVQQQEAARKLVGRYLGYGPLDDLLSDPWVNEVEVNRHDDIWIEKRGRKYRAEGVAFGSEEELLLAAQRMARRYGRELNRDHSIVDAMLADGSRLFAITEPIRIGGTSLVIRRFPPEPYRLDTLVSWGTLSREMADFLILLARGGATVLIGGPTGTGKSSLMQGVFLDARIEERIISIEDTDELRLDRFLPHVVSLQAQRRDEDEGTGITMGQLLTKVMRMSPERIIVGELRGSEVLAHIDSQWSGHHGSWTTAHSQERVEAALERVADLIVRADPSQTWENALHRARRAFDVLIHLERDPQGTRRITAITEILPDKGFHTVFRFHDGRFEKVGELSETLNTRLKERGGMTA